MIQVIYTLSMSSNKHLKQRAIRLRRSGQSYNNIIKALGIKSKGTLNAWFRDLKLSKRSKDLLSKNNELAHQRGLFMANKERGTRIEAENEKAQKDGRDLIGSISSHELLLIGTSLYWAEGMKSERTLPSLAFSNSDPLMISVYLRFIRQILKIPEEKIRAGIHIYPSIPADKARRFWSEITQLPEERFYIITQISKASKNKRPSNILPFGTVIIRVNNRFQFHKIKGMISGIVQNLNK